MNLTSVTVFGCSAPFNNVLTPPLASCSIQVCDAVGGLRERSHGQAS